VRAAFWIRTCLLGLSVAALEIACRTGVVSPLSVVAPSAMVASAWTILRAGHAWGDIGFSLRNIALASAVSILGGFAIGVALFYRRRLRRAAEPILAAYYAVPTFVLYPVLIVLFGLGSGPMVAIGALFGIVAMVVGTLAGLDSVSPALRDTAAVLRLSALRTLAHVEVPAAALHLFAGARLAVAYAIIGVVAGEFILSTQGVGKQIANAYNDFDTAAMYGYLLLLLGFAVAINLALQWLENSVRARWAP
jgi:NitT/TauT family transport system permease protein